MDLLTSIYNETGDSIKSDYNMNKNESKKLINETSNYLGSIFKLTNRDVEQVPFYLNYDWRVYRNVFLTIIFILFFIFKWIETQLVSRGYDKFLIKVYNLISFFTLINITIYFFMVTFNRYRSVLKGKKGPKGKRGKRGLQGKNSHCDISNKKVYTMKKIYNKKPKKEKVKNEDVIVDISKPPDKGWRLIESQVNTGPENPNAKEYINIMNNSYIGVKCEDEKDCPDINTKSVDYNNQTSPNVKTYRKQKEITLNSNKKIEQKPIIGVAANYDPDNNKITSLQYFVDSNSKHSKNRYNPELLGNRFGSKENKGEKLNFVCPNNSAIYKVDSIADKEGIVGLKYYCQDIITGKDVLIRDKNNYKSYGYIFGKEPKKDDKNYYFKNVKCEPLISNKDTDTKKINVYPSFISEVSGSSEDNIIKNLQFHKCSYYKQA